MGQHFQDVAQKFINEENLEYFAARFAKHFTQKPSSQKFHKIKSFNIIYTLNPIGSMKTRVK